MANHNSLFILHPSPHILLTENMLWKCMNNLQTAGALQLDTWTGLWR